MPKISMREDSSHAQFRVRVPADLRDKARGRMLMVELPAIGREGAFTVTGKIGVDVKFSLRTSDPGVARARHGAALAYVNARFEGMRSGPMPLSLRQIVALSGDVFRLFLDECGDDPGEVDNWAAIKGFNRAVREGRIMVAPALQPNPTHANEVGIAREVFGVDLTAGINGQPAGAPEAAALEARFGLLATWTLMRQGVEVTPDDRVRLLHAVERATTDAALVLKRHARMDFTPAPDVEARFPRFEAPKPVLPSLTLTEILDRWRAEVDPAPKTLANWRGVLRRFHAYIGHDDVRRVTPENLVGYKDHLLGDGVAARTVQRVHFIALHRLFGFAVDNLLIRENPVHGIRIVAKIRAGEGRLGYEDADVAQLLVLAAGETKPERRFGVLLLALTGARAGEVFQAWAEHVVERGGLPCLEIKPAPDGGRLKTAGSERAVPLHPAIVEAGFIEWVATKGSGPLFYAAGKIDPERLHPSNSATKRVGEWVRNNGFGGGRVAPLHGLRHWVKTTLHRTGAQDSTADAIQGHAGKTEAANYRHVDIKTMADAIARLPAPSVGRQLAP